MNVTLRQLRAFVAVADTGSFTLAAERLFITQSALSGLIKELESTLGLRLFDRSTRRLRLVDCAVESVMARVFSGEVDIGIGPEREANSDIAAEQLFSLPFMAVMPPTHALARRKKLLWPDLSGQSLITLQGQFTELLVSDVGEAARDMHKEAFMQVTYMTTALALARAGLGITLCMPYARTLVEQFGLVMRPVGHPVVERSFWVFTRRGRALSPAAQEFRTFLEDQLQSSRLC